MSWKVMTLLFMDVKGYSDLDSPHDTELFQKQVLPRVAEVTKRYYPKVINTWGDALFAAFENPPDGAMAALEIRDLFRNTNWRNQGFPQSLSARVALHCGSVYLCDDPITGRTNVFGTNVNLAARIEPIVTRDEVWVSTLGGALVQDLKNDDMVRLDPIGNHQLPKGAGEIMLFCLRRRTELQYTIEPTHEKSPFLSNFVRYEEPDMIDSCPAIISFGRAYRLLLHMFQHEHVDSFCAFDLAFSRWGSLIDEDVDDSLNTSIQIFRSIEDMLRDCRCRSFQRILMLSQDETKSIATSKVLHYIYEFESNLRNSGVDAHVETRVMLYPDRRGEQVLVHELCDFALFRSNDGHSLAIIEPALKTVNITTDPAIAECQVDCSTETASRLREGFDAHWRRARSLQSWLSIEASSDPDLGGRE